MLKKYLLPGCLIAALTACGGGQDLDYGPTNDSIPDSPPPTPEYVPQWRFTEASDVDAWTVEWNKPGSGNAEDSEIEWHDSQFALEIHPHWGGESVAKNDNITVYGTLPEPMDISYGTIYLSLYYTREHLGNPWGTGPYWGQSAHHMGTQYLLIDADGNRALLDTGNGGNWMNSFDIGNPEVNSFLRTDLDARGNQNAEGFETDEVGYWFDLAIKVGDENGFEPNEHYWPNGDNAGEFDVTRVVSFGVVMQYALEFSTRNTDTAFSDAKAYWDQFDGASERYIYIDEVALVPGEQPPPLPVEPPAALPELPEFGAPVYRDGLESGYNDAWPISLATADFDSDYGVMTGTSSIAVSYESAGGLFQIGAPAETPNLSSYSTFDFAVWVETGSGNTKLWVSLCDCDDGIEVTLVEEEWNLISIPVADFGKDFLYGAIGFKNNSDGPRNIYLDDIGFDRVSDDVVTFSIPVYSDGLEDGFNSTDLGSWGGTYTFNSATYADSGSTSIEVAYTGGYGGLQIAAEGVNISEQTTFNFAAYLPAGGPDSETNIRVALCDANGGCTDAEGKVITITEGEWQYFAIPVTELGPIVSGDRMPIEALTEIRFQDAADEQRTIYLDSMAFDPNLARVFELPVYLDGLEAGFNNTDLGSWGGAYTVNATAHVESGTNSYELAYSGGYGGLQIAVESSASDLSEFDDFRFAAYFPEGGATETTVRVALCDGSGLGCADADGEVVTIPAGQWTEFYFPLDDFEPGSGPRGPLAEIRIQDNQDAGNTIYIDNMGFGVKSLPPLTIDVYYDSVLGDGFTRQNGWGGAQSYSSKAQVHHGNTSIEADFVASSYGAVQIAADNIDLAEVSTFNVSAFGGAGSGDSTVLLQLCNGATGCGDNDGVQITVSEGKWQTYTIDIADFPDFGGNLTEIRLKNYSADANLIYFDTVGFK